MSSLQGLQQLLYVVSQLCLQKLGQLDKVAAYVLHLTQC